jgi:hypothetical protein
MRLLFIYEMLFYAYEFRRKAQTQAIDRSPLVDQGEDAISTGWNDQNEINHWKRCLQWWVGKCSFCAGKGLHGTLIKHLLKNCHRGGARQWRWGDGAWKLSGRKCQYGNLIYDTVIGLFYCDEKVYRIDAYSAMEEDSDPGDRGRTDEDVAIWLCNRLKVVDVECSLLVRTLAAWTKMVWRRQSVLST